MIKLEDFQILMIINSGQQNRIRTGEYFRGHTLSVKNYECDESRPTSRHGNKASAGYRTIF